MGRCTAVDILMLDGDVPARCGPEAMLRPDQRLPLLEEVWSALTDTERETIADRLNAQRSAEGVVIHDHGVKAGEGFKGATTDEVAAALGVDPFPKAALTGGSFVGNDLGAMLADDRADWRADLHKRGADRDLEKRTIELKAEEAGSLSGGPRFVTRLAHFDHKYEPGVFGICRRCGEEEH